MKESNSIYNKCREKLEEIIKCPYTDRNYYIGNSTLLENNETDENEENYFFNIQRKVKSKDWNINLMRLIDDGFHPIRIDHYEGKDTLMIKYNRI